MQLDYETLETLRLKHPAWNLLRADLASLVASFLHKHFLLTNQRTWPQSELAEKLEDELYRLRLVYGNDRFPREGLAYLDDWAQDDKAWLRKYYPPGTDEPHFDLTPATEKAIGWLAGLSQRSFVGTESRLLMVFELLRQLVEGSQVDPAARLAELRKRAEEIDDQMKKVKAGELEVLDATAQRDRFQQIVQTARDLLGDFREVEQNFRQLDRNLRERIALWDGSKGLLLDEILGQRDAIADSDQGRSFQAFWDFLMSQARQEELSDLLDRALELPAVLEALPDRRLRRIHYDWLNAGEHTQRTVSTLSQQLRRLLDDRTWLENRRIVEILQRVEGHAVAVKAEPPSGEFFALDGLGADIELPMERPLFNPPLKSALQSEGLELALEELDTDALYSQFYIDKEVLASRIRQSLGARHQVSLAEVLGEHPLEQGLAELLAYFTLASERPETVFDTELSQQVAWVNSDGQYKSATIPRILFVKS
jgi:hypothetical protein